MTALYLTDYCLWTQRQIQLLQTSNYAQLDIDNLANEMLQLAAHERKALQSHIEKMLYSFLKIKLYPTCLSSQSRSKLVRHRHRIRQSIARMPSMAPLLDGLIAAAYTQAAERLTARARLPRSTLPENLPYTKEQLLDKEFMPWTTISTIYDEYIADACPCAANEKAVDP